MDSVLYGQTLLYGVGARGGSPVTLEYHCMKRNLAIQSIRLNCTDTCFSYNFVNISIELTNVTIVSQLLFFVDFKVTDLHLKLF